MSEGRPPVSILLIDESGTWLPPVGAALGASGLSHALFSVADPAGLRAAFAGPEPDFILFSAAPTGSPGSQAIELSRQHWATVPALLLSDAPANPAGPIGSFDQLRRDQLGHLAGVIERAITSAREVSRLRRQAHAQALLAAHAQTVRKAVHLHDLIAGTRELPLGPGWKAIAVTLLDANLKAAGNWEESFGNAGPPATAAELQRLAVRAAQTGEPGHWLRDEAAGSALLALSIGQPAWAVLALAAKDGQPPAEDLEALATIAVDMDSSREFLATRAQVEYQARHNPVTGFPNRAAFEQALLSRMARGPLLVALLDVDRFRQFNDSRNRRYGDLLLGEIGARLRGLLPAGALFSHPQDDDFLIAFEFADGPSDAVAVVAQLVGRTCAEPFLVEAESVTVGMHASVLLAPLQGDTGDEIERSLSTVLAEARVGGQAVLAVSEESRMQAPLRAELERELRAAIAGHQFELFLQPKFDAISHALSGAEALIRWRHPTRGLVSPALFIPLLEDSGLIIELGAWVRSEGLSTWQRWRELGFAHLRLAVNVSPRELRHAGFIAGCEALLVPLGGEHGLDIEITESMLMADIGRSIQVLQSLRDLGCKIGIDDFGTGYSSLNYLSRLPADSLKIDQSFTAALVNSADALSMVTNIIGLAHSLGLSVVAEGVEEEEQANLLKLLRCDELQGYLLGKPLPASEFEQSFLLAPAAGVHAALSRRRSPARFGADASAAVLSGAPPRPVPPRRRPWLIASAVLALLLVLVVGWISQRTAAPLAAPGRAAGPLESVAIDSIAVMPFVDAGRGGKNQYLAEGLSEELIDRLTRIPQLRVIARGSALAMKDKVGDAGAVARALGVSSVLTGRLHRDGTRLSLDAELLAPDGILIWSHSYQREMTDLLQVEDEITRAVVAALHVQLLPEQEKALARRSTTNPEAFNQYLLGRSFFRQSTEESFQLSRSALEISIALDPNFAPAYAELANTVSYLADTAESAAGVAAGQARARELADKAVALDPQSAPGYRVRASLRGLAFDFEGAMHDTVQALRLNGGDSDNQRHYGLLLLSQGRLDEALLATTRAAELDPLSANAYVVMGMIHNAQSNSDAAIRMFEKALALTPGHTYAQGNLVQAWLLKGNATRARSLATAIKPGLWRTFAMALTEHSLGNHEAADAALRELVQTSAEGAAYQIAEVYAWRGQADLAFAWLERAYRQHDGGLEQIKNDPLLSRLRDDPRFAALVARLKLPD